MAWSASLSPWRTGAKLWQADATLAALPEEGDQREGEEVKMDEEDEGGQQLDEALVFSTAPSRFLGGASQAEVGPSNAFASTSTFHPPASSSVFSASSWAGDEDEGVGGATMGYEQDQRGVEPSRVGECGAAGAGKHDPPTSTGKYQDPAASPVSPHLDQLLFHPSLDLSPVLSPSQPTSKRSVSAPAETSSQQPPPDSQPNKQQYKVESTTPTGSPRAATTEQSTPLTNLKPVETPQHEEIKAMEDVFVSASHAIDLDSGSDSDPGIASSTFSSLANLSRSSSPAISPPPAAGPSSSTPSDPNNLGPLPLRPFRRSPFSFAVGSIFSSRADFYPDAHKACHLHGFRLTLRGKNRPGTAVVFQCSKRRHGGRCPFRVELSVDGNGERTSWTITKLINEHDHPALSREELGVWKAPEVRRTSEAGWERAGWDSGSEKDDVESTSTEDALVSEEEGANEDGKNMESVVATDEGAGDEDAEDVEGTRRVSDHGAEHPSGAPPSLRNGKRRRHSISSTSSSSKTSDLPLLISNLPRSTPTEPFNPAQRHFPSLASLLGWKDSFSDTLGDGLKLWQAGHTLRWRCSFGRKAHNASEGCPMQVFVVQRADGGLDIDEEESSLQHEHEEREMASRRGRTTRTTRSSSSASTNSDPFAAETPPRLPAPSQPAFTATRSSRILSSSAAPSVAPSSASSTGPRTPSLLAQYAARLRASSARAAAAPPAAGPSFFSSSQPRIAAVGANSAAPQAPLGPLAAYAAGLKSSQGGSAGTGQVGGALAPPGSTSYGASGGGAAGPSGLKRSAPLNTPAPSSLAKPKKTKKLKKSSPEVISLLDSDEEAEDRKPTIPNNLAPKSSPTFASPAPSAHSAAFATAFSTSSSPSPFATSSSLARPHGPTPTPAPVSGPSTPSLSSFLASLHPRRNLPAAFHVLFVGIGIKTVSKLQERLGTGGWSVLENELRAEAEEQGVRVEERDLGALEDCLLDWMDGNGAWR